MQILKAIPTSGGGGYAGDVYLITSDQTLTVPEGRIQYTYPYCITDGRLIIDGMLEMK